MHTIILILLIGYIGFVLFKRKLKINFVTLLLLSIIAVAIVNLITDNNQQAITYTRLKNDEQISNIYTQYSNHQLSFDTQVTRSLKPYQAISSHMLEPNVVVSDDHVIYSISNNHVVITDTATLKVMNRLEFDKKDVKLMSLYVTNDQLVVIGESENTTKIYIYQKRGLVPFKTMEIDSIYVSSRIIDNQLYLVASKIIDNASNARPSYKINGISNTLPHDKIYHISHTYSNNVVTILKSDLSKKNDLNLLAYLGLGHTIYFSETNLYIAEEYFANTGNDSNKTVIVKFNLPRFTLSGAADVKGYVLDQFSLSEYQNYLRVATSTEDENKLKEANHLYVLNDKMDIVGKLENFSRGNEIQAAAFIDDKAYIETFNILDPFYVIDLSNVKKPVIISELKFEGYNTNFVPLDKNTIIAFGLVLNDKKQAEGIKVSIYDVTNPKQVRITSQDTIMYKDYNSAYTDVLYDSKPLLLDRDKNILGFPIIYWINDPGSEVSFYKQFYSIYSIDKKTGLKKIGKISHYEVGEVNHMDDDIKRGLVIDNKLYTVSNYRIKEFLLPGLKFVKEIKI